MLFGSQAYFGTVPYTTGIFSWSLLEVRKSLLPQGKGGANRRGFDTRFL